MKAFMATLRAGLFFVGSLASGSFINDGRTAESEDRSAPNIVYILCDDLGYGDVRCLNPNGKIPTPNMDRLAASGMVFTDPHSSSSVCSPTRYGILTGRYNWRSRLKSGVLGGMSPRLIEPGRLIVPAFLKQHGYHTACIGKWHLGMDWTLKPDSEKFNDNTEKGADGWRVDFTKPIRNGPNSLGFDYFFGIGASLDMEVDWAVGQILSALDQNILAENTLVVFTSDNGCSPEAKFDELTAKGDNPSYHFRGTKADIFDGGHRIPFIVRWPGHVKAGDTSDQLICLADLFATCADIPAAKLPDKRCPRCFRSCASKIGAGDDPAR